MAAAYTAEPVSLLIATDSAHDSAVEDSETELEPSFHPAPSVSVRPLLEEPSTECHTSELPNPAAEQQTLIK